MKPLQLTEAWLNQARECFEKVLKSYTGDTALSFKMDAACAMPGMVKPTVAMTSSAYLKMRGLVQAHNKEIAWHGTVVKADHVYLIDDIYLYPQEVTAATVDADDAGYAKFLMDFDDENINRLRFQGHSHVNMPTSPSGRDSDNWNKFLQLLQLDEFYIFCIMNKSDSMYWCIYDKEDNCLYEPSDISFMVLSDAGENITAWAQEGIKKNIKEHTYQTPANIVAIPPNTRSTRSYYQESLEADAEWRAQYGLKAIEKGTAVQDEHKPYDSEDYLEDYDPDMDMYIVDSPKPGYKWNHIFRAYTKPANLQKEKKKPGRPKGGKKTNESK